MQFRKMRHTAALAIVLAAGPASMALAQSADVSASGNAGLILAAQQQTYLDVMANLEAAGYTVIETKTTFLGRVQITARNAAHLREVVVSRATGEVKSDVILETFATGDIAAAVDARCPAPTAPEGDQDWWKSLISLASAAPPADAGAECHGFGVGRAQIPLAVPCREAWLPVCRALPAVCPAGPAHRETVLAGPAVRWPGRWPRPLNRLPT